MTPLRPPGRGTGRTEYLIRSESNGKSPPIPRRVYERRYPAPIRYLNSPGGPGGESGLCPFTKAGVWTVRAVLETADGPITSPKVDITVTAAPKARPKGDEDGSGDHFFQIALVGGGGIGKQHFEHVRELEKLYPDTYRAAVLRRALLVAEYRYAAPGADRKKAADAVVEHAKNLPAHVRDKVYLDLAEAMVNAKEYVEAGGILGKVETAYDVSDLRKRIARQK